MHDKRFPNESERYRSARNELLQAEAELRAHVEKVAEQRRRLPVGGEVKEDYVFERMRTGGALEKVRLTELFAPGKDSLVIYSFMFGPKARAACPSCTSLIDGFDATAPHILQRVNMVVVAKSPIARIMEFARTRGWNRIPLLSSHDNTYNADYWAEDEAGNQMPMVNVFARRDDKVHHFWGSELLYAGLEGAPRHVDLLWPLWNIFDLTPQGRGADWHPRLSY